MLNCVQLHTRPSDPRATFTLKIRDCFPNDSADCKEPQSLSCHKLQNYGKKLEAVSQKLEPEADCRFEEHEEILPKSQTPKNPVFLCFTDEGNTANSNVD